MKKTSVALMITGLIISLTVSPVFAWSDRIHHTRVSRHFPQYHRVSHHPVTHYRVGYHPVRYNYVRYHHVTHYDDWGAFGVGLLTGSIVTNLLYGLPQRQVVVYDSPQVVYYSNPVKIQKPPSVIEIPEDPTGEAVVTTALLNVRSGPGKDHPVTHQVRWGSKLVIKGSSAGWLYVELPSGEYGWVMQEFTTRVQSPANG